MYSVFVTYRGDRARGADGARSPAARAQAAPVYRGTLTPSTLRWSTRLPVIRIELVLFLPAKQRTFKNDCKLNSLFITYFRSYFYCPKKSCQGQLSLGRHRKYKSSKFIISSVFSSFVSSGKAESRNFVSIFNIETKYSNT